MRIFCTANDSHFFQQKYNSVFVIFTFENLTKRELTTSLISNNRPQICDEKLLSMQRVNTESILLNKSLAWVDK